MSLDFYLDIATGRRVQSPGYALPATDTPSGKLMSTQQVRIQYLRVTGQTGTPVAAPSSTIKFGLKPGTIALGNYSDTTFDSYTDTFTAPSDPTLAGAFYTATLTIDGAALRALFPVDGNGKSPGTVALIGEILSGGVPSDTFPFTAQNNVIKNTESPAVAVAGASGYPASAAVQTAIAQAATASRDYIGENYQAFASRVAGKTAGAGTINIFSAGDLSAGTGYVRNTALWCADIDLTCFSPWNSTETYLQGGCLITPRHVALANHFSGPTGSNPMTPGVTTMKFVAADNTIYTRTVTALARCGSSDVLIATLDSDLPAPIKPAKILPGDIGQFHVSGLPMLVTNQQKQAHIALADGSYYPVSHTWVPHPASGAPFVSWTVNGANNGDSGSPNGFIFNGDFYLSCLTHQGDGSGDSVGYQLPAINAILGSQYALSVPAFSNTVDPLALRQGDAASLSAVGADTYIFPAAGTRFTDDHDDPLSVVVLTTNADGTFNPLSGTPGQSIRVKSDSTGFECYTPPGTAPACDVYVDSVLGNDSYRGQTAAAPLKSLRAARAACLRTGTEARLGLARGSRWGESLDLSTISNANVQAYGTGAAPIIDGADAVTAWTLAAGRTNVYQATVTHDATGSSRLTVYEDGALLLRVADQATCDSTPGSFVDAKGSDGSPVTIYVRPAAGGNPASNGHLYEVSVRNVVLLLGAGATVSGVQTMRAIDNNGSLDAVNAPGVAISRVLALDGTKHNLGIGSGTATDCLVARADAPTSYEPSNLAFVAFLNDPTGQTATFERCGVFGQTPGGDLGAHGDPNPFAAVNLRQFWNVSNGFPGDTTTNEGSYYGGGVITLPLGGGTRTRTLMRLGPADAASGIGNYGASIVTDCVLFAAGRESQGNPYFEIFRFSGPATFSHCAFAGPTMDSTNWCANGSGTETVTMNGCVFFGGVRHISIHAGMTYVGDYNVFYPSYAAEVFNHNTSGDITTLAAWQSATGQDAHSVYLKAADQSAGNAGAFWLGVASGTSTGPAAGDWRVNPAAKVYGADGTAYVGTFPDGTTAITQAGPQTHWDWNARASAAGAPTAWPNVPATVADAQAYVAHPDAWVF